MEIRAKGEVPSEAFAAKMDQDSGIRGLRDRYKLSGADG